MSRTKHGPSGGLQSKSVTRHLGGSHSPGEDPPVEEPALSRSRSGRCLQEQCFPEEGDELSRDGGLGLVGVLATDEGAVTSAQSLVGSAGELDDASWRTCPTSLACIARTDRPGEVLGALDEESAQARVARARDCAASDALSGRMLAGNQAAIGSDLLSSGEAPRIADLAGHAQCRQYADSAESLECHDLSANIGLLGAPQDALVERLERRDAQAELAQEEVQRQLVLRQFHAQLA